MSGAFDKSKVAHDLQRASMRLFASCMKLPPEYGGDVALVKQSIGALAFSAALTELIAYRVLKQFAGGPASSFALEVESAVPLFIEAVARDISHLTAPGFVAWEGVSSADLMQSFAQRKAEAGVHVAQAIIPANVAFLALLTTLRPVLAEEYFPGNTRPFGHFGFAGALMSSVCLGGASGTMDFMRGVMTLDEEVTKTVLGAARGAVEHRQSGAANTGCVVAVTCILAIPVSLFLASY